MKLSEIPKEELELMGYDDIAYIVLQESGKKMKLVDIFTKVCKALELPESVIEAQIMDFFELMSINKKFVMLKNGFWDLQSRHKPDIVVEDVEEDEESIEEVDEIDDMVEAENEDEDIFYDKDDDTDDVVEDELSDLMVIDPDDEQNL